MTAKRQTARTTTSKKKTVRAVKKTASKVPISTPAPTEAQEVVTDLVALPIIPTPIAIPEAELVPVKVRKKSWWQNNFVNKAIVKTGIVAETEDQRKAFDEYLAMGDNRTVTAVANKIGRRAAVVQAWARKFKWTNRVIEWSQQDSVARSIEPLDEQIAMKRLQVKILNKMIADVAVMNDDGTVKEVKVHLRSMTDLAKAFETRNITIYGEQNKDNGGKSTTQIGQAVFILKK